MKVGVPTEIKTDEYRVALTPAGVRELVEHGHEVVIQSEAGVGSTIPDEEYTAQGARIAPDAASVFEEAEMILGVKEPQPQEVELLRPGHLLFTYLHLAPAPDLTKGLVGSGATCVAYETVADENGHLPLLAPMSEVAGKIATQAGAYYLERPLGGRGVLLGGVPGVAAATTATSCCARSRSSSNRTGSGSAPRASSSATGTRCATGSGESRSSPGAT